MAHPSAGLATLLEMTSRVHVGIASVLRFVNKVGFDGFRDIQRPLRDEFHERHPAPFARYGSALASSGATKMLSMG